jgi:hypothetical protein
MDSKERALEANDREWVSYYARLIRREETAVMACLAGGKDLAEAREIAKEMYARDKAHALRACQDSCNELYNYREEKRRADRQKIPAKKWWQWR